MPRCPHSPPKARLLRDSRDKAGSWEISSKAEERMVLGTEVPDPNAMEDPAGTYTREGGRALERWDGGKLRMPALFLLPGVQPALPS